jgi:hypothetical protein
VVHASAADNLCHQLLSSSAGVLPCCCERLTKLFMHSSRGSYMPLIPLQHTQLLPYRAAAAAQRRMYTSRAIAWATPGRWTCGNESSQ